MNDRDPLDLAVRALRDAGEPPAEDVARTRARMLETLQRGERRSRRTFWVVLPIAAVLAASTALAKNSEIFQRAWDGVATTVGLSLAKPRVPAERPSALRAQPRAVDERVSPAPDLAPASDRTPAPTADVALPPPVEEGAPPSSLSGSAPSSNETNDDARRSFASPMPGPHVATARTARPSRSRADSRVTAAEVATPVNSAPEVEAPVNSAPTLSPTATAINEAEAASLSLYKKAYQLHFVERRYAAALVAWDEYLHEVPGGRLTVEARYNRAIALVRLGRRQEAETALQPFARGEVGGGYRMREARDLLAILGLGTP